MGIERRKHPRLAISVDVDVESGSNFYEAKTRDISVGGLFVETDIELPVGTEITVRMQLQNRQFSAQATVVWQMLSEAGKPKGVGVEFTKLRPLMREAIERFMAVRGPMENLEPELVEGDDEPPKKKGPPPLPR